ncbi:unnamed protein product [Anisakis simplex]|uniref:Protein HGH1 homolog n=1 Tax=Anisakis simplex TaxID=6269 RepID=A0A158PNT4_ANISI|nr:unnamed protein product [Anisakis simplex]
MGDENQASNSALSELVQFLEPHARTDIRHSAIAYIVGVSATEQGAELFKKDDFALLRAVCSLYESTPSDRSALLSALTNIASSDIVTSNFIIENSRLVTITTESCHKRDDVAAFSAKLLSNLSLHFPSKVFPSIVHIWETFVTDVVALLNENASEDFVDYLGYVLVNSTELRNVRSEICTEHLQSLLPLINQNQQPKRRLIAVNIIRNLCFDDENHERLLDKDDEFLSCIVKPLADSNDELDEDEIEKLPLQLQYYDQPRLKDPIIINSIIDALYQLCATAYGRNVLRNKGIYALLRELDKSMNKGSSSRSEHKKIEVGKMVLLENESESPLHALIGMLIRDECDIRLSDSDCSTIRHLK